MIHLLYQLETFLYRKAASCLVILIAAAAALGQRAAVPAGLALGLALGILRFKASARIFQKTAERAEKSKPVQAALRSAVALMLRELLLLLTLYVSMVLDAGLFAGVVSGILIIPLVIFLSGITECTGITHHCFQSGAK